MNGETYESLKKEQRTRRGRVVSMWVDRARARAPLFLWPRADEAGRQDSGNVADTPPTKEETRRTHAPAPLQCARTHYRSRRLLCARLPLPVKQPDRDGSPSACTGSFEARRATTSGRPVVPALFRSFRAAFAVAQAPIGVHARLCVPRAAPHRRRRFGLPPPVNGARAERQFPSTLKTSPPSPLGAATPTPKTITGGL